jgi:hypothetical protein
MELQHEAIIRKAYETKIEFIYAVHHYQGLLDYIDSRYFKSEDEARQYYKEYVSKAEQEIQDNGYEIYQHEDTELYFEGPECAEKILLEAIVLPR